MKRFPVLSPYCNPVVSPRITVSPPVFASVLDAWNHFVRHRDDYPYEDDDPSVESSDNTILLDSQSDVFDVIDFFTSQSNPVRRPGGADAPPTAWPAARSAGDDDEVHEEEETASAGPPADGGGPGEV